MQQDASTESVAIVTGAGSGIGRAVCVRLAAAGWRLAMVGRRRERLEETRRLVAADDPRRPDAAAADERAIIIAADLTDHRQAEGVIDETAERWGRIDALVNNAGHAALRPIEEADEAHVAEAFAVNAIAPATLMARVWPIWRRQAAAGGARRGGRLVNVSSMATVDPFPGLLAYAGAKAALESFTRSAMNEGRDHGILAFSVAPGAVETEMLRGIVSENDLPASSTLDPAVVAAVICDCVEGRRDAEAGTTILVPSPISDVT